MNFAVITIQKETPALGHDWNRETTEDASCESDGEKTYTCRRCGDKKERDNSGNRT